MRPAPDFTFFEFGIALTHQLFVDPFIKQFRGDLGVKLVVEPGAKPADLIARVGIARHQGVDRHGFVQVFADRLRFRHHLVVDLQHRHLARRIAAQKVGRGFPIAFLDQFHLKLFLGQRQANLAAIGREREMIKADHCGAYGFGRFSMQRHGGEFNGMVSQRTENSRHGHRH